MLITFIFIMIILSHAGPKSLLIARQYKVEQHNVTECQLGAGGIIMKTLPQD